MQKQKKERMRGKEEGRSGKGGGENSNNPFRVLRSSRSSPSRTMKRIMIGVSRRIFLHRGIVLLFHGPDTGAAGESDNDGDDDNDDDEPTAALEREEGSGCSGPIAGEDEEGEGSKDPLMALNSSRRAER